MNLSEEKLNRLESLLLGEQSFDPDEIIQKYTPGYFQVVLRAIPTPIDLTYYRPILDRALELNNPIFRTLLEELFVEKNFKEILNVFFFLKYVNGPVLKEVQDSKELTIWLIEAATILIKNFQDWGDRYFLNSDFDDECFRILKNLNLFSKTEHNNVYNFAVNDRNQFHQKIEGIEPFEKLSRCWGDTYNLQSDTHMIAMSTIYKAFERKFFENDKDLLLLSTHFSWTIKNYLKEAYSYFSNNINENSNIEKCHQIVWLILKFYANDKEQGIFQPYSNVGDEIVDICTSYMLLSPEEHLSLFNLYYRDFQYSKFAKYGLEYTGAELSGSGGSGDGIDIQLNDASYVEFLLEPFLEFFYTRFKLDTSAPSFFNYLDRHFIKAGEEISSLNPVLLRRASVKSLVKLLRDKKVLKKQCFIIFNSYLDIKDGIPSLSSKLFAELLTYENDGEFLKEHGASILKLIKRSLLSAYKGLINQFAFRLLLVLRKYKVSGTQKLIKKLFNNPDFVSKDNFLYSILANIEKRIGLESPEMEFAVGKFLKNKRWQSNHGAYSFQAIARFIGAKGSTNSYIDNLNSFNPNLFQIIAPDILRKESETNPERAVRLIHELVNGASPHKRFENTEFIPGVLEKYFNCFSVEQWEEKSELMVKIFEICDMLLEDPNPGIMDDYHKQVLENEEISIIGTTRGYFAFCVRQLSCSKKYFEKAWYYTDKLLSDSNLYVVHEAFSPLYEILRRRQWNGQIKVQAIRRLWEFFNRSNPKAIEKQIFHCFHTVRDLKEEEALLVLKRYSEFDGIAELLIFYAVFRINVKGWRPFNDKPFRSLLKEYISSKSSDFNHRVLRIFSDCIDKDNKIIDSIYPFLKLYIRKKYAAQNLYNSLFSVFNSILNAESNTSKTEIMKLLNAILDSHFIYLSKTKGTYNFYYGSGFLTKLYDYSKTIFYFFIKRLLKIVALTGGYIDTRGFKKILLSETDPEQSNLIREVIDSLIDAFPADYTFRKEWEVYAIEKKLI